MLGYKGIQLTCGAGCLGVVGGGIDCLAAGWLALEEFFCEAQISFFFSKHWSVAIPLGQIPARERPSLWEEMAQQESSQESQQE